MNRKTLLLLASTILATGVIADIPANAKVNQASNGAIIRQLPRDNTMELLEIFEQNSSYAKRFERQYALIDYYERTMDFEKSDALFMELVGMLKELDEPMKSKEVDKYSERVREQMFFHPNIARYYYRYSVWQRNFGSSEVALEALKKALSIDKTNPQYHYDYAQYALDENDYDKAIAIMETLKREYPRELTYRVGLAKAYTQCGKYDDAIREYRVAFAFDPDDNDTVVALNELTQYSKVAHYSGGQFYDPMTTVKPVASPSGEKLVAFNASVDSKQTAPAQNVVTNNVTGKKQIVTSERPAVSTQTRVTQADKSMTAAKNTAKTVKKAPTGSRRVMVSYINGRKVVKIVNINTDTDTSQSLREASSTFSSQLESSNSGYDIAESRPVNTEKYEFKTEHTPATFQVTAFEKPLPETTVQKTQPVAAKTTAQKPVAPKTTAQKTTTQKTTVKPAPVKPAVQQKTTPKAAPVQPKAEMTTKSKYQVNEKDYITDRKPVAQTTTDTPVAETTSTGDPSVKALSYKAANAGRKQLLVTYKNGKRVVQMISADGTPMSTVNAAHKQEKEQNKLQEQNDRQNEKILKQQEKQKQKGEKESKKFEDKKAHSAKTSQKVQDKLNANDNTDLYVKANEFLAQEQYQAAIDTLKQVQPATLRSLTAMASCYNALGNPDAAIEYYKKADKLSPSNTQILYSLGYLYYTKNDVPMAKKYIDTALTADPTNQNALQLRQYITQQDSNVVMNKVVAFMNEGNYSESRKLLERILQDNPSDFQSYYYLGHVSYATQKYEDAARNFSAAIKNNPEYALSYYSLGLAYDKLKEFNKSLAAYQQFLQMESDDNKYTQYAKTRVNTIRAKQ